MKSDPHYRRSPFEREQIQAACNQAGRLTSLDAPVQVLAAKGDFGTLVEVSKKSKSSTQFNATRACLSWAAPSARNYSDHFMLGSAYVALGDHRQAMESFHRARSYQGLSSNESGEVLYALGESQYALGLREEARTSAVNSDYFRPSAAAKDLLRRIGTGRYLPPSSPPAAVTISVAPPPVLTSPQTPKPVVAEPLIPGGKLRTTSVHENDFNAVSLRGVQPTIFVRHRIVKGRAFTPGTQEIVIPDEFKSVNRIEIGQPVTIQGRQWILVGVVRSRKWNEVWGDLDAVKKAYGK